MASSKPRGYTLIELLTVIAVTGIIAMVATTLLIGQGRFFTSSAFQAANQAFTANALASLAEQLKTADHVVASRNFTVSGSTTTYTSGLHTVILALPIVNSSGAPILATPQLFDYLLVTADPAAPSHLVLVTAPDATSFRTAQMRTIHSNYQVFNVLYNGDPASITAPPSVITLVLGGRSTVVNTSLATSQVSIRMRNF